MHRIWVTGLGVLAPNGSTLEDFWSSLVEPAPRFGPARCLLPSRVLAAEILTDDFNNYLPAGVKQILCDRSALMALSAANAALKDAALSPGNYDPLRVAVVTGNGAGGQTTTEQQYEFYFKDGRKRVSPLTVAKVMTSSTASWISMAFGFRGPAFVVSSACASATHSIGVAAQLVQSGLVDIAVTGGVEACLTTGTLRAWEAMGIVASDTCRPFARGRSGLVLAEGAGIVVLESEAHAKARGAMPRAQFAGYGASADAGDLTKPSVDGMARAMANALANANMSPRDIAYINAHGTGTRTNDKFETQAIHSVFPSQADLLVSSTKSVTGHALGAAGGLEAVASVLALQRGVIPPTANYDAPDPECDLDVVPNVARVRRIGTAMSNSFAFGGLNASVIFTAAT